MDEGCLNCELPVTEIHPAPGPLELARYRRTVTHIWHHATQPVILHISPSSCLLSLSLSLSLIMQWHAGICVGVLVNQCDRYCVDLTRWVKGVHKHFDITDDVPHSVAEANAARYLEDMNVQHKLSQNNWRYIDETGRHIEVQLDTETGESTLVDAESYERVMRGKRWVASSTSSRKRYAMLQSNAVPLEHFIRRGPVEIVHKDGNRLNNTLENTAEKAQWDAQRKERAKATRKAREQRKRAEALEASM
jgi:hypothetical protein